MENYKKIKNDVTKIINKIDPWGLISAGAPDDEYDEIVNKIISLYFNKKLDNQNIKKIFGTAGVSEKIISDIKEEVSMYFI